MLILNKASQLAHSWAWKNQASFLEGGGWVGGVYISQTGILGCNYGLNERSLFKSVTSYLCSQVLAPGT